MNHDLPLPLVPRWEALVLVCKACGKRGSGPKKLRPKDVAQELRSMGKRERMRTRVVLTTCLGLCPKRAVAVTLAAPDGAQRTVAIESRGALAGAAYLLQPVAAPDAGAVAGD